MQAKLAEHELSVEVLMADYAGPSPIVRTVRRPTLNKQGLRMETRLRPTNYTEATSSKPNIKLKPRTVAIAGGGLAATATGGGVLYHVLTSDDDERSAKKDR